MVGSVVAPIVYGPEVDVHPFSSVTVKVYVPADAPVKLVVGDDIPFQSKVNVPTPPKAVNPVISPSFPLHVSGLITAGPEMTIGVATTIVTGTLKGASQNPI